MSKHRTLLWLLSLVTLLAACTSPSQAPGQSNSGEPKKGGILRVAWLGNPPKVLHPNPDPPSNTSTLADVAGLFMSGLLSFNSDSLDYFVSSDDSLATA